MDGGTIVLESIRLRSENLAFLSNKTQQSFFVFSRFGSFKELDSCTVVQHAFRASLANAWHTAARDWWAGRFVSVLFCSVFLRNALETSVVNLPQVDSIKSLQQLCDIFRFCCCFDFLWTFVFMRMEKIRWEIVATVTLTWNSNSNSNTALEWKNERINQSINRIEEKDARLRKPGRGILSEWVNESIESSRVESSRDVLKDTAGLIAHLFSLDRIERINPSSWHRFIDIVFCPTDRNLR